MLNKNFAIQAKVEDRNLLISACEKAIDYIELDIEHQLDKFVETWFENLPKIKLLRLLIDVEAPFKKMLDVLKIDDFNSSKKFLREVRYSKYISKSILDIEKEYLEEDWKLNELYEIIATARNPLFTELVISDPDVILILNALGGQDCDSV